MSFFAVNCDDLQPSTPASVVQNIGYQTNVCELGAGRAPSVIVLDSAQSLAAPEGSPLSTSECDAYLTRMERWIQNSTSDPDSVGRLNLRVDEVRRMIASVLRDGGDNARERLDRVCRSMATEGGPLYERRSFAPTATGVVFFSFSGALPLSTAIPAD